MRILVIDDDAFALRLATHQLGKLGFTDVTALARPEDALERLEHDVAEFDMVLLDLQMPGIDGVEFVRHLARLRFAGGVALVSGEDERILQTAHRLARAHDLEVRGALHKPITPEQLSALLGPPGTGPRRSRAARKTYTADRLAQAIAAGELVNVYQPQVALATGEVIGVETLVRWQHPDDGMVFPDQFIPLAEEHRLIDDLTRTVLEQAVAQAHEWQGAGLAFHVGVNVSMDNLAALDFPDFVARTLARLGTTNRALVLEVTESRLMTNALASLDIVARLRLKHIGLSIDDFGTGHSSLAQLRDIPFDELKVDRSFVHGAAGNAASRAILEGSISMARHLGMRVVAEGVEDRADWDLLRQLDCDVAQGYFIARPMPAAGLPAWLAEWEARRAELAG
ncbi:MAG: EAL domain-containing response regulator [Gemmatimonadaceae bacterium]|nr:EAL domain-containing response regulator [Gemmatimonadaceae bacterium]